MSQLPEQFRGLEPLLDAWAIETEDARWRKRISSEMSEIRELYDAINPRLDEIVHYLNGFALDSLPEDARRLLALALSYIEVSPAVEVLGQPDSRDAFEAARIVVEEGDAGGWRS